MLYISRVIGKDKYGVVDTDDYIETVCTYRQLYEYCVGLGMEIRGVSLQEAAISGFVSIKEIVVYQNPAYATKAMTKAAVIQGVDVKVSGTDIVSVTVNPAIGKSHVKLRLSDYGKTCSGFIFSKCRVPDGASLTVILDDKIKLKSKTLADVVYIRGLFFDVTEVTNIRTLDLIYIRGCAINKCHLSEFELYIIDGAERMDYYRAVDIVFNRFKDFPGATTTTALFDNCEELSEKLLERFGVEFDKIMEVPLKFRGTSAYWVSWFKNRYTVRQFKKSYEDGTFSYSLVRSVIPDMLIVLEQELIGVDMKSLLRFGNYAELFEPPRDMRNKIMRFVMRVVRKLEEVD